MWKITAEYIKLNVAGTPGTRCVIECPEGHPFDIAKQTVAKYLTKRCRSCEVTYTLPTTTRKNTSKAIVELDDCFDMSYAEIAEFTNLSLSEVIKNCDSGMKKLLSLVDASPELSDAFSGYLETSQLRHHSL